MAQKNGAKKGKNTKNAKNVKKETDVEEVREEIAEEYDDIIELIDDDENIIKFKLFDVTEYKGAKYALLIPAEPNDAVAEGEVAIFLFNEEEKTLERIDDEALLEEVFEFYQNEEDEE